MLFESLLERLNVCLSTWVSFFYSIPWKLKDRQVKNAGKSTEGKIHGIM